MDGIESEREICRTGRGQGTPGSAQPGPAYMCAMRCIGLAGREWRRRREKEEKDRAVKLVCRSVTA